MGAILPFALTACNDTKAFPSQCAYIIGNGTGDSHQIKSIVHPGGQVHNTADDISEFVPCNSRNFLITDQANTGDRKEPALGRTAKSETAPALPVKGFLRMYWTLNQSDDALRSFLPFCEKYGCYTTDGGKVTGNANFSTPGWNGMLRENHSLVINKVFAEAVATFGPNLWQDQALWPKVAEHMSAHFAEEMRATTGSDKDFFCGSWFKKEDRTEVCTPVRFQIDSIAPVDPAIADIQQQTALAQQQKALRDAQAAANKNRYGSLSDYYNGLQDTIRACKDAGQSCTIIVGGSGNVNVTPQGK